MGWLDQAMFSSGDDMNLQVLFLSLVSAFLMGQLLAWTYSWTHTGLSYSRSFTQALVLVSLSSTMVMFVVGNSLVTAFGLLGALAIIRFRNNLKDTRDTVFVFFSLIIGMAVGNDRLPAGILATLVFCAVVFFLYFTSFGSRGLFDGHLRCRMKPGQEDSLRGVLQAYCLKSRRISSSHGADSIELVYEVLLRDQLRGDDFIQAVKEEDSVQDAGLVVRDRLQEA